MQGFLTCRKTYDNGADAFTSPPKEVVLRIFIALKIHRPATLDPSNFVSSGRYANHYTTEATSMFIS
jgi:hypothetical protein